MQRRLLLSQPQLDITVGRLCQQLIENHHDFRDSVILGLQPRGVPLALRITESLVNEGIQVACGFLDSTFYRDDFRRRESPKRANETKIDFLIEGKKVILIDDVFYTGRSVRAALDAMIAFGRPAKVELLVLVERKYARDLPIKPDYIGKQVNTIDTQKVLVEWKDESIVDDNVWLVNKEV